MTPTDIALLAYNRLDHLIRTVDAIEANTPEPHRLIIVDNASDAPTRAWLAANRERFDELILLPVNIQLRAWDRAIQACTSDPFVLTDGDLVVPELEPPWLSRLLGLMDRHPDFGLVGAALDPINRPPVLGPEDPGVPVTEDLVEGDLGVWFLMCRQDTISPPFLGDTQMRNRVRARGWRVGWTPHIRALHLGWDDHRVNPEHLVAKDQAPRHMWGDYAEVELLPRPPRLAELAVAGPVAALGRAAGVPDASMLELTWEQPTLAVSVAGAVSLQAPAPAAVPAQDAGAGLVSIVAPPASAVDAVLAEGARVAARLLVLDASLETVGARLAPDLAPPGWRGREQGATGELVLAMARHADGGLDPAQRFGVLGDREHWLGFFAGAAVGRSARRLFVFERDVALPVPDAVRLRDGAEPWRPAPEPPPLRRPALRERPRRAVAKLRRLLGRQ